MDPTIRDLVVHIPQGPAFLEAMTSVTSKRLITRSASRLRPASMCGEDSQGGSETSSGPLYDPHLVSMFGITASKAALMHAGTQVLAGTTPFTSNSSACSILALPAHSSYGVSSSSAGSASPAALPAERSGSAAQQALHAGYAASHLRPRMSAPQQQPPQAFDLAAAALYRPQPVSATANTSSSGDAANYIIGADRSSASSSVNSGMDPERISPPSPHSPHPPPDSGLPNALNTPRRSSCSRGVSRLRLSTRALVAGGGIEQPAGIDLDVATGSTSVPEGLEDGSVRAGGAVSNTPAPLTTIASLLQLPDDPQPRLATDAPTRRMNSGGLVTMPSRSRIVLGAANLALAGVSPDNNTGVLRPQQQPERGSSSADEPTELRSAEGVSDTSANAKLSDNPVQARRSSAAVTAAALDQAPKRSFWAILCGCASPEVTHG